MSSRFGALLRRSLLRAEARIARLWRPLSRRLGRERPRTLIAYTGWVTGSAIFCSGRLLANPPSGHGGEAASWWRNLRDSYRRWESDEIPGVSVRAALAGYTQTVRSDDEGYVHFELPLEERLGGPYWQQIRLSVIALPGGAPAPALEANCPVINPDVAAEFGVISDLDDTVIESGITKLWVAARLTLLGNARSRKAFEGVAALYRALHTGSARAGAPVNPIFYVSSSPWNLYDLLDEFIQLKDIPRGPLLLQDWGLDESKFVAAGLTHKLNAARRVLADYPTLPFVLFGDSGQHDAGLYAQLAEEHPGRVLAIFIRDVDPAGALDRDDKVDVQIRRAQAVGVPMWLVPDSLSAARHLLKLGLLPAEVMPGIEHERDVDQGLE